MLTIDPLTASPASLRRQHARGRGREDGVVTLDQHFTGIDAMSCRGVSGALRALTAGFGTGNGPTTRSVATLAGPVELNLADGGIAAPTL
jgi:hypothetical protein